MVYTFASFDFIMEEFRDTLNTSLEAFNRRVLWKDAFARATGALELEK